MGATIGKGIHQALFGKGRKDGAKPSGKRPVCSKRSAKTPAWELKSMMEGRRRYYAAAFVGNVSLAKHVEETLSKEPFVKKVQVSILTGSLLIEYTGDEETMERVMQEIRMRLVTIRQREGHKGMTLAKLGASIRRTVLDANACLRRSTAGYIDFSSLLSIIFIVRGLRKVIALGQRPSGPQMLWWALSLLRGWRLA